MQNPALQKEILECTVDKFNDLALKIFRLQAKECSVYAEWLQYNNISADKIDTASQIPYMPISFFKTQKIGFSAKHTGRYVVFESSSTTGSGASRHFVPFSDWYEQIFQSAFEMFYGNVADMVILALLPSYLDRPNSSLVYMADKLIQHAAPGSGFFKTNFGDLKTALENAANSGKEVLLLGVTYALLDYADWDPALLSNIIVMETGGMKGRRKEMTRNELHETLNKKFKGPIHSEYGMTELLSQAYSKGDGIFHAPPWMQIKTTEINDPNAFEAYGKTGRICVTDLGNLYSCSFLATDDLGKVYADGSFEILGRFDFSDTRGCNLMW